MKPGLAPILACCVLGVVATAVTFVVRAATILPDGPVDLVWDKTACAHCSMHVGEPEFAAQLQTTDGRTLAFDDPGCLFEYLAGAHPEVHAIWFHHQKEDRWLPWTAVAFVAVQPTPMGYGLGAVDPADGTIDLATARERCRDHTIHGANR